MTTLVWLAASSLVWGGVLWGAATALQSGNDLSGRARQWIWRGAAVLLIMPWLAVPIVGALAPGLSGSVTPTTDLSMTSTLVDTSATLAAMNMADMIESAEPAIVIPWIEIIVAMVIGGWLLRIVAAGRAARHLDRIISDSRPGEGATLTIMARWSRVLGLRRAPELRVVSANTSPFSTGVRKPLVCLPEGIEQSMQTETLDLVVGHECIHVARGDGWRRPLERSIADIMWFNPFAWAIRRELDLARELACDEAVVAASSQRKAYARTLRVVAGMAAALPASAPAASMSFTGGGRMLAMRMKRTLDAAARRPAKAVIAGAVMLAFAATPMAIAQAILIEAVQPPDAPPAPPAPPAPVALAEVAQAPTPPAAPKAPQYMLMSSDGVVRIAFPARVVEVGGNDAKGYSVKLLQPSKNAEGEICSAKIDGLSRIAVAKGQVLAKDAVIGERGKSDTVSIAVRCSDKTDANGWPVDGNAPPAPPAPPVPPAADAVAPVAPVSPTSRAAPRPAPVAQPTPPATTFTTPATPTPPITPLTPVTPPSRSATPTLEVLPPASLPRVERVQYVDGAPAPVISSIVVTGNRGVDARMVLSYVLVKPGEALTGEKLKQSIRDLNATGLFSDVQFQLRGGSELIVKVTEKPTSTGALPALERIQFAPGKSEPVLEGAARRTSAFGYRTDPFSNKTVFHTGVDLAQNPDSSVRSPADAVVTFAGIRGEWGRMVELAIDDNTRLRLGHLNRIDVVQGEQVASGQVVGTMGNSGQGTGPHLHLEVIKGGNLVDPETVEGLVLSGG